MYFLKAYVMCSISVRPPTADPQARIRQCACSESMSCASVEIAMSGTTGKRTTVMTRSQQRGCSICCPGSRRATLEPHSPLCCEEGDHRRDADRFPPCL